MKKNFMVKSSLLAAVGALMLVGQGVQAVDLADAAAVMAEVESMSVQAKAALAAAAVEGDTDALAEAQKRSDAIDAAVASARGAYAQLEQNIQNGDLDAAETAEDDLAAALEQVSEALLGALPETAGGPGQGAQRSGARPGRPDDPPNPAEVPWKSQGIKAYYQSLFGTFWNASAFGHGQGFGDRDATPE